MAHFRIFRRLGYLRLAKGVILAVPLVLFLWLLQENLIFPGSLQATLRPGKSSKYISPGVAGLEAAYRTNNQLRWRLADDVLPLSVRSPRLLQSLRLRLRLKNVNQPIILLKAKLATGADLTEVAYNDFLEHLTWPRITDRSLTLWQRPAYSVEQVDSKTKKTQMVEIVPRQYASVAEFLREPPSVQSIGVLGVNATRFSRLSGYTAPSRAITIEHALRGQHTIITYAGSEAITFSLEKIDLNRASGADGVSVIVSHNDRQIFRKVIPDDGERKGTGKRGPIQPLTFSVENDGPGIYRIELQGSDDVLFQKITSSQTKLVFQNHIFLADGPAYAYDGPFAPVTVETNIRTVVVETSHEQGLQKISVGRKKFEVEKVKEPLTMHFTEPGTSVLTIPQGDLYLSGDGFFSLQPAEFFNVDLAYTLPLDSQPHLDALQYIISTYHPLAQSGTLTIDRTYRGSQLAWSDHRASFSLEAPGLYANRATVELNSVTIDLKRIDISPWRGVSRAIRTFFGWQL